MCVHLFTFNFVGYSTEESACFKQMYHFTDKTPLLLIPRVVIEIYIRCGFNTKTSSQQSHEMLLCKSLQVSETPYFPKESIYTE